MSPSLPQTRELPVSSENLPKVLILANPTSGARGNRQKQLERAQVELEKAGFSVHIGLETEPRLIRERACNATLAGTEIIVAAGGDGTINAVANGMLRATGGALPASKMGVLPLGTGNVFAFNLHLGRNLKEACKIIAAGNIRRIDVGLARPLEQSRASNKKRADANHDRPSPRYFLLMAGLGFDAKVIEDTSLRLKMMLRDFAYALRSLQNGLVHQGAQVTLSFPDGAKHSGMAWMLMAGNAASYAWAIRFTRRARLDDGKLDLCLFPFQNKLLSTQQVMQLLMGQHIERGSVEYFQTPSVKIEASPPIPVQLDGDEWGTTPLEISILPGALDVLAPPDREN